MEIHDILCLQFSSSQDLLGLFLSGLLFCWGFFLTYSFYSSSGQFLLLGDAMQSTLHFFTRLNGFSLGVCLIPKAMSIPGSNSKPVLRCQ